MKNLIFGTLIALLFPYHANSQEIDTLIDVGGYKLHFNVLNGKGIPLLFEAGGGNDGSVWNGIKKKIAAITQAPIITYDRIGLGKSSPNNTPIGIENEIAGLKSGLSKLGFDEHIMLVCHSLGGFYATLYASRFPNDVKAAVFIDANLPCFFTEEHLLKMEASKNFRAIIDVINKNPLPVTIPVIDIVSEQTLFEGTPDAERWKKCHQDFASLSPERKEIIAYETGHYVFNVNKQLVINAIVTLYANKVMPEKKASILERGYEQAQVDANEDRRNLMKYWHSENDLNEWGYALLQKNEVKKAIEVFKLNVLLHPESANTYDSLGEVYLKDGNKELAIQNYKHSLKLNPNNENAKKVLKQLSN